MAPKLDDASSSVTERMLHSVCHYQAVLYLALVLESMLLLLAGLSLLVADLGKATATVLAINFGLLGVVLVVTIAGLGLCHHRQP